MCAALAADPPGIPVLAVVKEEERPEPVDEEKKLGVAEFADDYFCGPLYLDPEREFYKALGDKPIFTLRTLGKALLNPFKFRKELKEQGERFKAKEIDGNMQGDGLVKGGILVIAPDGDVKCIFEEDPGNGVPEVEAKRIIAAAKALSPAASAAGR